MSPALAGRFFTTDPSGKPVKMCRNNNLGEFPGGPVSRLSTSTAGGMDSIFGWGTKIPQARGAAKKRKRKEKKRNFLRGGQRKRILPRILEGTVKAVGKAPRENVKENHLYQL